MLVTPAGMVTLVSEEQPLKVLLPMLVTPAGMVTLVSKEQSENAEDEIWVTGFPAMVLGIDKAPPTVFVKSVIVT